MRRRSSSTSNSEQSMDKVPRLRTLQAILWSVIFLCVFDVAANVIFHYPSNPLDINPSKLALYFDYGRSIESKLRRQLGATDESSAPIAKAGWLSSVPDPDQPTKAKPGHRLLSIYGNSFAERVAFKLQKLDPTIDLRMPSGSRCLSKSFLYGLYHRSRALQCRIRGFGHPSLVGEAYGFHQRNGTFSQGSDPIYLSSLFPGWCREPGQG